MIPSGVLLVVYGLCVYRLTRLVTTDTITEPGRDALRRRIERGADAPTLWAFDLVTCDWCISVWIAAGCAIGWQFARSWFNLVAVVFALSAVAGILRERVA